MWTWGGVLMYRITLASAGFGVFMYCALKKNHSFIQCLLRIHFVDGPVLRVGSRES